MINGKKYEQHKYFDPKTKAITSHYAISYDNPSNVHVFKKAEFQTPIHNGAAQLQQFCTDHANFCTKARIDATEKSVQAQIQNIAAQCIQGNLSPQQAEQLELDLRQQHEQALFLKENHDRVKKDQQELREQIKENNEKNNQNTLTAPLTSGKPAGENGAQRDNQKTKNDTHPLQTPSPDKSPGTQPNPTPHPNPEPLQEEDTPQEYSYACESNDDDNTPKETDAQQLRRELINAQESWIENADVSSASQDEKNMINSMLNSMVHAENDMVIELAQECLRSWDRAQKSQSDAEYAYHMQKSKNSYETVRNKAPEQSLPKQAEPVKPAQLDNLCKQYKTIIETDQQAARKKIDTKKSAYQDRFQKRAQALIESKKQLQTKNPLPQQTYNVSQQARTFMMSNNMNYAAFDSAAVTSFQHCLTQEIIGIIESSARISANHDSASPVGQLAKQNCNLAVSAQQLNQSSRIEQAVAVNDLSHFFDAYTKALVDSGVQSQTMMDINLGILDGTAQSLQNWSNFTKDLCNDPPCNDW